MEYRDSLVPDGVELIGLLGFQGQPNTASPVSLHRGVIIFGEIARLVSLSSFNKGGTLWAVGR